MRRFGLYVLRWQAFTPAPVAVHSLMKGSNTWIAAASASPVGTCLFFWVDRVIFKNDFEFPVLQVCRKATCIDCGKTMRRYRLVRSEKGERISEENLEVRCGACSRKKAEILADESIPAYMLAAYRFHEAQRSS